MLSNYHLVFNSIQCFHISYASALIFSNSSVMLLFSHSGKCLLFAALCSLHYKAICSPQSIIKINVRHNALSYTVQLKGNLMPARR